MAEFKRKRKPVHMQTYVVIARAVEEGVTYGLQRYFKYHCDDKRPVDIDIAEHVKREVLSALCGVIRFSEECTTQHHA